MTFNNVRGKSGIDVSSVSLNFPPPSALVSRMSYKRLCRTRNPIGSRAYLSFVPGGLARVRNGVRLIAKGFPPLPDFPLNTYISLCRGAEDIKPGRCLEITIGNKTSGGTYHNKAPGQALATGSR